MSNSIIINRVKHPSILADHRVDPVTKKLLKVGDEVCVCAVCKTVYLKDVWKNTMKGKCCKQTKTLLCIPNTEYGVKETPPVIEKSYKTHFLFFLLATFLFLGLIIYWYNLYNNEHIQKQNLYFDIKKLSEKNRDKNKEYGNKIDSLEKENNNLKNSKKSLDSVLNRLNNISKSTFCIGKNIHETNSDSYDQNYLMFLKTYVSLKIDNLYVKPNQNDYLIIELYNEFNVLIDSIEVYVKSNIGWNKIDVNFEIPNPGVYYLKRTGNVPLFYDKVSGNYDSCVDSNIKILGCSNSINEYYKREYYQYYYDIHYSLLTE
ncbi:hypothetical protein C8N46_105266 [Kordia periserrulae]|uniref:Uncharacterized protein n=1 Tax=Kordia periserrulae TaxID=701523 RepID=A0A2T6BYF6_9FLAO|nr:hypothetical protein [Kordia periserrulae]PTX61110.1 hypothetical protein C8N46_105266 [Kordia periserrulae]